VREAQNCGLLETHYDESSNKPHAAFVTH